MADKSRLRIVGGEWRGRKLEFLNLPTIRPTPDRVRETLFNWLMFSIRGKICLDLFSGSGALSFEAISRGAREAVAVDVNPAVCRQISREIRRFDSDRISAVTSSAKDFLATNERLFDIVFLDPPFDGNLLDETLSLLVNGNHLTEKEACVYVEHPSDSDFAIPESWQVLSDGKTSQVRYALLASEDGDNKLAV